MKRLAIVTTHPIQYNAPLFALLHKRQRIQLKVFYTWSQSEEGNIFDPGFGIEKAWDIPLLEGYAYHFSKNISTRPGSHHFKGVNNPQLVQEIESFKPDAVMVYGWPFRSHLKVMRHFHKKIPVYFRGDSTLLNEKKGFSIQKIFRRVLLKYVYRHIDHAFYPGTFSREYFIKHGIRPNKLHFMPHAIDNNRFYQENISAILGLRQQLNIDPASILFVYAGKFEKVKNPGGLLHAFRELQQYNVHLLMVGNGALELALKQQYAAEPTIHFLPFQNQRVIPAVYQIADVFVLPSVSESWGLSVNEAMAAGKAVLVSNKCGCYADLVQDDVNGYVFESGNETDLVQKIERLIAKGKQGLQVMGAASQKIIAKWSFEQDAEIIENTLIG